MNDRRTRTLAILATAALGLLLVDRGYAALWSGPSAKLDEELQKARLELVKARTIVAREEEVKAEWRRLRERMDKRPADVPNHFVSHLGAIAARVGGRLDITPAPPAQQGDFREYPFEMRFKLTWGQFVDLLAELHDSREFLKPLRVHVSSQYEREDRLDLDLKVSTIEFAPAPAKAGGK
ncbi:MAG TPA: hypothetical protein VEJ18_10640 [Planctomycetota bacterium]|nr:hypothetical protein [Planctomycetota bacterium]